MNIKDPYSEMIKLMQQHGSKYNPPSIQLGEVTSISPLTIHTGDIQLNKNNLLVADYLLKDYSRNVSLESTSASGETDLQAVGDHGSHKHGITSVNFQGPLNLEDGLKKNDIVALIQMDTATFLILCRVVKP